MSTDTASPAGTSPDLGLPTGPSPAEPGRVLHIHVAPSAGEPMQSVERAEAIAGTGLAGDRYANLTGHWSPTARRGDRLTLIEQEEIDRLAVAQGIRLHPGEARRNITTRGIRLDGLIGHQFAIGPVICRAIRRCEPCTYLEGLLGREVLYSLVHRAGIRVEVLTGGVISVGDRIEVLAD